MENGLWSNGVHFVFIGESMSAKISFAEIQEDPEFQAILIDFWTYVAKKNAIKQIADEEPDYSSRPVSVKGPHWHCFVCGWDKAIPSIANPAPPPRCGKCKSPYWQKMPNSGPHDPSCEDCLHELARLQEEAERIDEIVKGFKRK
jgi:hypothetical protein